MTPLKLIAQTIVLYCLGISAIFLIFSQPEDTSATWLRTLFLSKTAGIVTALIFFRLHRRWMKPAHTPSPNQKILGQSARTPAASKPQNLTM